MQNPAGALASPRHVPHAYCRETAPRTVSPPPTAKTEQTLCFELLPRAQTTVAVALAMIPTAPSTRHTITGPAASTEANRHCPRWHGPSATASQRGRVSPNQMWDQI